MLLYQRMNVSYSAYEFAVTYSMDTLSYVILLINNSSHTHVHLDQIRVKVPSTDYLEVFTRIMEHFSCIRLLILLSPD